MPDSGIDWDWYDHGPGSEEWKRKRAEEQGASQIRVCKERRQAKEKADKYDKLMARFSEIAGGSLVSDKVLRSMAFQIHTCKLAGISPHVVLVIADAESILREIAHWRQAAGLIEPKDSEGGWCLMSDYRPTVEQAVERTGRL